MNFVWRIYCFNALALSLLCSFCFDSKHYAVFFFFFFLIQFDVCTCTNRSKYTQCTYMESACMCLKCSFLVAYIRCHVARFQCSFHTIALSLTHTPFNIIAAQFTQCTYEMRKRRAITLMANKRTWLLGWLSLSLSHCTVCMPNAYMCEKRCMLICKVRPWKRSNT